MTEYVFQIQITEKEMDIIEYMASKNFEIIEQDFLIKNKDGFDSLIDKGLVNVHESNDNVVDFFIIPHPFLMNIYMFYKEQEEDKIMKRVEGNKLPVFITNTRN